jgi:A/G-specific adenine glycosylase
METKTFTHNLLAWYDQHGRDLPWRNTTDPYKIMISEFMLQQTQVSRVIVKYNQFLTQFPTIQDLAKANLADVLKLWQGLGYNRRAKYIHNAAKELKDKDFPNTVEELQLLNGFGPYTAGAVVVFAYNTPALAIDANVKNVFNKVFGVGEKEIPELVKEAIPKERARDFFNALMDIGSQYYKSTSDYQFYPFKEFCCFFNKLPIEPLKKIKQPKFEGSNRYFRGQVLKLLCDKPVIFTELKKRGMQYVDAANQLVSEGMVQEKKGTYTLD